MNKYLNFAPLLMLATPAYATGGLVCRTANARPIEVSVGFWPCTWRTADREPVD